MCVYGCGVCMDVYMGVVCVVCMYGKYVRAWCVCMGLVCVMCVVVYVYGCVYVGVGGMCVYVFGMCICMIVVYVWYLYMGVGFVF